MALAEALSFVSARVILGLVGETEQRTRFTWQLDTNSFTAS